MIVKTVDLHLGQAPLIKSHITMAIMVNYF